MPANRRRACWSIARWSTRCSAAPTRWAPHPLRRPQPRSERARCRAQSLVRNRRRRCRIFRPSTARCRPREPRLSRGDVRRHLSGRARACACAAAIPTAFASTLRDISAAVDPNLQLRDIATAEIVVEARAGPDAPDRHHASVLVMLSVMVLSAAGIYALMSFTVARRRREIGIRAALGADRNRLLGRHLRSRARAAGDRRGWPGCSAPSHSNRSSTRARCSRARAP